jgi:RimJ/RimL family protein N-acetyltransferase
VLLETEIDGLRLRSLREIDPDAYVALVRANAVHLTRGGDYRELIQKTDEELRAEVAVAAADLVFAVELDGSMVGRVDLIPRDPGHVVIGYWLAEPATGRGSMTAAIETLLGHARSDLGATDVWAGVTKGNEPSARLLARCGFERVSDEGSYERFHRSLG